MDSVYYRGDQCYLGDVCGGGGGGGLCSEGLGAQQETCRRIRVYSALKHKNTHMIDSVLMKLMKDYWLFWCHFINTDWAQHIKTQFRGILHPHPWSFICESLPHHWDLLIGTQNINRFRNWKLIWIQSVCSQRDSLVFWSVVLWGSSVCQHILTASLRRHTVWTSSSQPSNLTYPNT